MFLFCLVKDNIHPPHSAARLPALPTHSPLYRTEPSVTAATVCLGSGSLGQAGWGTGRQQSVCSAAGGALTVVRIITEAEYLSRYQLHVQLASYDGNDLVHFRGAWQESKSV